MSIYRQSTVDKLTYNAKLRSRIRGILSAMDEFGCWSDILDTDQNATKYNSEMCQNPVF